MDPKIKWLKITWKGLSLLHLCEMRFWSIFLTHLGWKNVFWRALLETKKRCFHPHTLILHHACFNNNFLTAIKLFTEFLSNLKKLVHFKQSFINYFSERQYKGHSKIEVLDTFQCENLWTTHFQKWLIWKKLSATRMCVTWFRNLCIFPKLVWILVPGMYGHLLQNLLCNAEWINKFPWNIPVCSKFK